MEKFQKNAEFKIKSNVFASERAYAFVVDEIRGMSTL